VKDVLACFYQRTQGLRKELNEKIDETQLDLQLVMTSIDTCIGNLKDDITDTNDCQEAIANTRKDLHEELGHMFQVEARADVKQERAFAAVALAGWDPSALRREQLNDKNTGPILEEVKTEQRSKWKDIAHRSPTYKSYWAQYKSLALRDGIVERHWESADGRSKISTIVLPRSRVKDVLAELHGGSSGGHLGVNKPLDKVRQKYCRVQAKSNQHCFLPGPWCRQCDTCAASRGPPTRNRG
jgi:hypothetical protein